MTAPDTIWTRLAAPVSREKVAWRQDGKVATRNGKFWARFVPYIEANTVRERLDSVAPGWLTKLEPLTAGADSDGVSLTAFKCALTLTVNGDAPPRAVTREDVGQGDDYKSAATDAFKRAGTRFGIGHELADFDVLWVEMDGDGKYAKPLEDPSAAYERLLNKKASTPTTARPAAAERAAPAPAPNGDVPPCPVCDGPMWDNRPNHERGEFLKSPALKCKDKGCEGRYMKWPPKEGEKRGNPTGSTRSRTKSAPSSDEPPPPDDGFGDLPGGV